MNRYRDDGDHAKHGALGTSSDQLLALIPEGDVDQLAETLVAFANADGGTVYLGVAEGGLPTGEVFPEDIEAVVQQAELKCRPPVRVEWEQMETGGNFAFVGRVYRSPVLHVLDDGRILVRTGDLNRLLTSAQVQQMAASRSVGDYEAEPAVGMTRADLDDEVLREFVQVWEERQGRQLTRPLDDFLTEMGWLLPDGQPTVAGVLLFGKSPATFLPRCGVTFVRFEGMQLRGPDGGASYGRRVEINAALAHTIKRTWDIIKEEIHIGAVVRGLRREEQWVYPPTAIREALVNAIAHRDYRLRGRAIEVRMFSDHLEITSPGGLPGFITLDNIVDEHFSRNPRIVSGLFQWGYIEELGMGVDLMIDEMARAGHPVPAFKATDATFSVTFQNVQQRVPLPPGGTSGLTMNERQAKALAYVQQNARIRSRDYQELCPDVSPETLRLDLADLVDRGLFLKIGEKRGTYYILK
ncbi:MAG: putative DNA binding domain-containing protein [Anaerolineae bacterium]|nr:putative DNA binding domain-containing protein [Anaerolineae bacterium]